MLVTPAALASLRPHSRNASQQSTAKTDPEGPTRWGQLDRGIAKATTRINNLIALFHRQTREDRLAMKGQTIHQNVLPADEFRHQYVIPEIDVLTVLTFFLHKSFNGHITLPRTTS